MPKSKSPVIAFILTLFATALASGQQFVISTFAGGGPPKTPAAAKSLAIDPQAMAADPSGNLFFISGNCVFKVDSNGTLTRVAGSSRTGYSGDGGPALAATFRNPQGIAADAAGNVYIADSGNHRIRKVSAAGIISTIAGTGTAGNSGDGGPALQAQFSDPTSLAADTAGNLLLVDVDRIRKISAAGIASTVAGNGTDGFSGDGGPAINAQLSQPYAIAADQAGNLYISDDGNRRVRKVSTAGVISTLAGTGQYGMASDGGSASTASISGASGIAADFAGNVYFTDSSPQNDGLDCACVRKISAAGVITTVGSNFWQPRALAIASGNLFVTDSSRGVIAQIAPGGGVTIEAGSGVGISTGGSIYFYGDGAPATGAQFNWPGGVVADAAGNVFVADTFNNRVRMVSPAGVITTVAGGGANGLGEGGPATSAELYYPVGVAADSHGNLYIADHGNRRIRRVSNTGTIGTVLELAQVYNGGQVWNLTIDKNDNLYVPDPANNRILKLDPSGAVTTVAGNGTFGYTGDGGPATSASIRLTSKAALATDSAGNLYFSDDDSQTPPGIVPSSTTSTPRIRRVSPNGTITTVAGSGTSGFSGDGGPATQAQLGSQLNYPVALAVDNAGNLYIGDGDNRRVRMVAKSGVISTAAGTASPGYSGDGGPAVNAQLDAPAGLAADNAGNVYVVDQFNRVIRLLQPVSSTTGVGAVSNAASGIAGSISPGEIVVISGSLLGPPQLISAAVTSDGVYPSQVAGTTVEFDGTAAPILYSWATQVAAVVPYAVVSGTSQVTVAYQGHVSAPVSVPVADSAPGIFTIDSSGKGQASALNADGSVNSPSHPAKAGSVISLFVTGTGETTPAGADGRLAADPLPQTLLPVSVMVAGVSVTPSYAGATAGAVAGLLRIDVPLPASLTGSSVPVVVQVGNSTSQQGVTIAIQ